MRQYVHVRARKRERKQDDQCAYRERKLPVLLLNLTGRRILFNTEQFIEARVVDIAAARHTTHALHAGEAAKHGCKAGSN